MMSYNCAKRFKYGGEERENENPNETISSIDDNPTSPIHMDAKLSSSSTPPLSSLTNKFPLHSSYQYPPYSYPYYGQDTGYNFNYYQQQQQQQYGQVFNPRVQANRNSMGSSGSDTSSASLASPQSADLAYAKSAGSKKRRPIPVENKDEQYWEKRRKNNESAKRSRDLRRSKEEHISVRVIYLEQENLQLRTELAMMKTETEKLRAMLYAASNSALVATNSASVV